MRVRDHIAVSAAAAALAQPWWGRRAFGFLAGGVLVDVDHYLWFCARARSVNPVAAMRFFNEADPPQHTGTRVLHNPAVPLALLLLAARWRALLPVAAGMTLHIALDGEHDARLARARIAALERDAFACRACGANSEIGTHLQSQPWLLPSYEASRLVALCGSCHAAAHAGDATWN